MSRQYHNSEKIFDCRSIVKKIELWQKEETIVFTNGCFDILHLGHIDYLIKSSKLGTKLIVGLNSDESVRQIKGNDRPIQNEQSRANVLASINCIDAVVLFNEKTSKIINLSFQVY